MHKKITGALMATLGFAFVAHTVMAQPTEQNNQAQSPRAEMLAQTCAGCHGTQGYLKDNAFMPLAGMPTTQFINAMKSFADGTRPSTVMGPLAQAFSTAEIEAMAAYFAQFPKDKVDAK